MLVKSIEERFSENNYLFLKVLFTQEKLIELIKLCDSMTNYKFEFKIIFINLLEIV